jgi:hypothetical protein
MFEDLEDKEFMEDKGDEPSGREESGNRTFVAAAIALGALTILAVICIGVYLFLRAQGGVDRAAQETQAAVGFAQQTQDALSVQQTVEAQSWTATPTATTVPTATPRPTDVLNLPTATEAGVATEDPATDTIAALLTQAAGQPTLDPSAIASITAISTQLPDTGLFDDFDVTGLVMLAAFALIVIFLARRMRSSMR